MKIASIQEEDLGVFILEYDNTQGQKNAMRLDAATYEKAVREARVYLGIDESNCDPDGTQWYIE